MDELFLPASIIMGIVTFSLIARWYIIPALAKTSLSQALIPLLLIHCFRYIGLAFLIPGVTSQPLDLRFANPAAYGDLLAGVLALLAVIALKCNWKIAIPAVWIFNVFGTLDLFNALFQGFRHTSSGHMGATYFIPTVAVPALLVTHYLIFQILLEEKT